jgi:hypothetical protein
MLQDPVRGEALRQDLTSSIQEFPAPALFWECPPVTLETASSQEFEYVLLPAPALAGVTEDPDVFSEHFVRFAGQVTTFTNLGGDARLVAPCPSQLGQGKGKGSSFAHLAVLLRTSGSAYSSELQQVVVKQMPQCHERCGRHRPA